MDEVKLPTGAILKIGHTPFSESKLLYQAVLKEAKSVSFSSKEDLAKVMKDMFCAGFSSKEVDAALDICMKRCTYNGLKIDDKTFEPLNTREDYSVVCIEVIQKNIGPFLKGLYAEFDRLLGIIPGART